VRVLLVFIPIYYFLVGAMKNFESHLSAALKQVRMGKEQGSTVYLAAVSGGADSTAMLAGLAELRKEAGFVLHCVHVEHGLRPADESRGDAGAVEALCENLKVACSVVSIPPGKIAAFACNGGPGIEGAARIFRYRALKREARRVKADWILTAHTQDDLLETLLMRVLRGAGPAGLAPMPKIKGRILRPLLDIRRQDVLEYLEEKGLSYRTDSTNSNIRFLRNRVRQKLIPLLNEYFPSWQSSLLALAETQSLTAAFLASEARARLPWEETGAPGGGVSLRLSEAEFLKAPSILQEEAIFAASDMLAALKNAGGKAGKIVRHTAVPITAVPRRAVVRRALERNAQSDLGPVRLEKKNGFITLTPAPEPGGERGFSLVIREQGSYVLKDPVLGRGKNLELRINPCEPGKNRNDTAGAFPNAASFEASSFPLVFRSHREGDRVFQGGHRRKFSDALDKDSRSVYTGVITVCDIKGTAAIIGMGADGCMTAVSREDDGKNSFFIEVNAAGKVFRG